MLSVQGSVAAVFFGNVVLVTADEALVRHAPVCLDAPPVPAPLTCVPPIVPLETLDRPQVGEAVGSVGLNGVSETQFVLAVASCVVSNSEYL